MQSQVRDVVVITPYYHEPLWMLQRNILSAMNQPLPKNYRVRHVVVPDMGLKEFEDAAGKDLDHWLATFPIHKINGEKGYTLLVRPRTENGGLSAARNSGLKVCPKNSFVFLLDTDDMMAENRIAPHVEFMIENELDHSYGGYKPIHGNASEPEDKVFMGDPNMKTALLNGVNPCYCGSNVFRIGVAKKIGMFDEAMRDGAEDMEFWIRIMKDPDLKSGLFKEVCYYLGIHGNNMTARYLAEQRFEKAYAYIESKHDDLDFNF